MPARSDRPTEGFTLSPSRSRPPPRCTTACPSAKPSIAVTNPSPGQGTSRCTGAAGSRSGQRSTKSTGPPCAATMRPKYSAAAPLSSAASIRAAPSAASAARPPSASASPPSAAVRSQSAVLTEVPVSVSITSITSSALPAAVAKGWLISVISAVVMQPAPCAAATSARASASA